MTNTSETADKNGVLQLYIVFQQWMLNQTTCQEAWKEWQEWFNGNEAQTEGTGPYLANIYSVPTLTFMK